MGARDHVDEEGWGISVLEAAACGTPTVASDTPGLRDAFVHGESGVFVRPTDERPDTRMVELPGWPLDHERFLRETLASVVGLPLTLDAVRRVAEPLAPTSPVAERDDRIDRRRTPRRSEAGDHADRRQR